MKRRATPLMIGIATAALVAAGAASAAWLSSATGTARARAIPGDELVVTQATAPASLYPGSTGATITVTVANRNPYPVRVTAISAGDAGAITAADSAGNPVLPCSAAHDISYGWTTTSGLDHVVGPDGGTFTYTLTGALSMGNGSHAECSGAVFTVPVSVSATSAAGTAPTVPNTATVAVP